MRTLIALAACALLLAPWSAPAQPTVLTYGDIPTAPGAVFHYAAAADTALQDSSGIPFDPGGAGADQTWDFQLGGGMTVQRDSIFDPAAGPHGDLFPDATRGVSGQGTLPGMEAGVMRYEVANDSAWGITGVGVSITLPDSFGIPPIQQALAFDTLLGISPLPLAMGVTWTATDTVDTVYTDTTGLQVLLVLEYGMSCEADAWGSATFEGGSELDVVRVQRFFGGELNAYPIVFGEPLPIPVYTEVFPLSLIYSWYAPGVGEVMSAVSMPGDGEEDFDEASLLRWYLPEGLAAPEPPVAERPTRVRLAQAWPNPFNAGLSLRYELDRPGRVRLELLDLLGRRVATLAEGERAAGSHRLAWAPERLASGTYLLRLVSGGASDQRRVVHVK